MIAYLCACSEEPFLIFPPTIAKYSHFNDNLVTFFAPGRRKTGLCTYCINFRVISKILKLSVSLIKPTLNIQPGRIRVPTGTYKNDGQKGLRLKTDETLCK